MSIMEVRGLVVRYGTGRQVLTAVDHVDLVVPDGDTVLQAGDHLVLIRSSGPVSSPD